MGFFSVHISKAIRVMHFLLFFVENYKLTNDRFSTSVVSCESLGFRNCVVDETTN